MLRLLAILAITRACFGAIDCDKRMTGTSGEFQTPYYPYSRYPVNTNCSYVIKAPPNHYVEITFLKFKLEPMYRGLMTDYLKIRDGKKVSYYHGTISTPFKFTSITSRVILKFVSNHEYNFKGFSAKYKALPHTSCKPLVIDHGSVNCDVNSKTKKIISCDVISCDNNYHLHGNRTVKCIDGSFVSPPKCLPLCEPLAVKHGKAKCDVIPQSQKVSSCDVIACDKKYQLSVNETAMCFNGSFTSSPECSPIPKIMKRCSANITSCPYEPIEVAQFLLNNEPELSAEQSEEERLAMLEQVEADFVMRQPPGRTAGPAQKQHVCNIKVCSPGWKYGRKYLIRCRTYFSLPAFNKMDGNEKTRRLISCLMCQMYSCKRPVPHVYFP